MPGTLRICIVVPCKYNATSECLRAASLLHGLAPPHGLVGLLSGHQRPGYEQDVLARPFEQMARENEDDLAV